jgi:hypothetical protein
MNGMKFRVCDSTTGGWNNKGMITIDTPSQTAWGTWDAQYTMCPLGSFITSMNGRLEKKLGNGDDTALNGV